PAMSRTVVNPRIKVRRASATVFAYIRPGSVNASGEFGATVMCQCASVSPSWQGWTCMQPPSHRSGLLGSCRVARLSLCCVTIGSPHSMATDTSCPAEPPLKRCDQFWGSLHAQATAGAGRLQGEASIDQQYACLRIPTEGDVRHCGARRFSPARP